MTVINGYQSKGVIEETKLAYDNVVLTCFADSWPEKIGLADTTYLRFGPATKTIKIPTGVLVDCLGIKFTLGDDSRDVLKRFDFENKIVGAEIMPVYNEKGKVVSVSFNFADGSTLSADIPADNPVEVTDTVQQDKTKTPKK